MCNYWLTHVFPFRSHAPGGPSESTHRSCKPSVVVLFGSCVLHKLQERGGALDDSRVVDVEIPHKSDKVGTVLKVFGPAEQRICNGRYEIGHQTEENWVGDAFADEQLAIQILMGLSRVREN
jgi:hypothetical protein